MDLNAEPLAAAEPAAPVAAAEAAPAAPAAAQEIELTLHEFCLRLSSKMGRKGVELIAGFHAVERAAGAIKDVESAFTARFEAWRDKPVA